MTRNLLTAIFLLVVAVLHSQNGATGINLEQVLNLGSKNNHALLQTAQSVQLANARLAKANSWWVPELSAGMNSHFLNGAALNANGRFYLDIRQKTLWTGLSAIADWKLMDGIAGTKMARLDNAAARLNAQANRNEILLQIVRNYFDLLAAQMNWQAWQQLAEKSDSIARQTEAYAQSGLVAGSTSMLAKSNALRLHAETLKHKAHWQQKAGDLAAWLDLPPGTALFATDTLLPLVNIADDLITGKNLSNQQIAATHPRILAATKSLEFENRAVKTATWGWLWPQLFVRAYSARFGGFFDKVHPVDSAAFPDPQNSYNTTGLDAGISWNIPLSTLTHGGERKEAQANQKIASLELEKQIARITNNFAATRASLIIARDRVKMATSAAAIAEEALRQSMQRQQYGTLEPMETMQALENVIKARLELIEAVCDHNKLEYELWIAAGKSL